MFAFPLVMTVRSLASVSAPVSRITADEASNATTRRHHQVAELGGDPSLGPGG
jgi:hypothetical protein